MHIDTPLPIPSEARLPFHRKLITRATAKFVTYHFPVLITAFGILIILLQFFEHRSLRDHSGTSFYGEVILLVLLLISATYLARWLLDSLDEKSHLLHILELKHEIGMDLASSQDIGEARRRLDQEIAWISPAADAELFLYEKNNNHFKTAAEPAAGDDSPAVLDAAPCRQCFVNKTHKLQALSLCPHKEVSRLEEGYCLQLGQGSCPVGLLLLHTRFPANLTSQEMELLENVAPEIASSLLSIMEKKARVEDVLDQKIRDVHLDIARDLHDTLAQNISYLRMKLEYLSEQALHTEVNLPAEISHLSEIANESYDQVRGSLTVLQSASSTNLLQLFTRYMDLVADRSGFKIDFTSRGNPQPLSPIHVRQLFMIFRESISNIEKHAKASQVEVEMDWKNDSLSLSFADNGCGFNPPVNLSGGLSGGHYGLRFIAERTQVLKGSFCVHSTIGAGTRLDIQIPYE